MLVNSCIGGTGCKGKAKEGWAAAGRLGCNAITSAGPLAFPGWLTGDGSLQWFLCVKQLGPAWDNYPAARALRAQALDFAVFRIFAKPVWSQTTGSQRYWTSSLTWFWETEDADGFWGHLAALSEEEPACHVCFAAFYCKKSPWRDLYAVTCSAFLPKIQPVHAGALMWQVCLASGVISNYPNLGASSFRPVCFFLFFFPSSRLDIKFHLPNLQMQLL